MNYTAPWDEPTQGKIKSKTIRGEITSSISFSVGGRGLDLFYAACRICALDNASEAVEDALDEMEKILKYYDKKSLDYAIKFVPLPHKNIEFVNKMNFVYDSK